MDAAPELRVIAKYGVGFDKIDLPAIISRNIALGWTGGVNRRSVSELVIGFAIAMLRQFSAANDAVLNDNWHQVIGRQLSDCTVGIIGCGHVGKDLGRMLRAAFGCSVIAHDIIEDDTYFAETGVVPVSLNTLLSEADVVSVHLPHDASTHYFLDAARAQHQENNVLKHHAEDEQRQRLPLKVVCLMKPEPRLSQQSRYHLL